MARQAGPLYFTGTIDDITFYKMEGEYFAHKKSSLDRRQFRTDHRFARSRKSAAKFGEACQLASQIYWQLPKGARKKGLIGTLTGQVGRLLRERKSPGDIIQVLKTMGVNYISMAKPAFVKPVRRTMSSWKIEANGQLSNSTTAKFIGKPSPILHEKGDLSCKPCHPPSCYLTLIL